MECPFLSKVLQVLHSVPTVTFRDGFKELPCKVDVHVWNMACHTFSSIETTGLYKHT